MQLNRSPDLPSSPFRCLFPAASGFSSCVRATNPHAFETDGVHFLGTRCEKCVNMCENMILRNEN